MSLLEVAEKLKVSEQTVRRWVKRGELPAHKPGKEYRIAESDVERFMAARKT